MADLNSKSTSVLYDEMLLNNNVDQFGPEYYKFLIDQYKLYVEMADRISARRMIANTFFLGINTAVISAMSIIYKEGFPAPKLWMLIPFITLINFCYVWWRIVKSYKQLNSGKYSIIGQIEESLPLMPYKVEWAILGKGKDGKLYQSITHIEYWVPIFFGFLYFTLAIAFFM